MDLGTPRLRKWTASTCVVACIVAAGAFGKSWVEGRDHTLKATREFVVPEVQELSGLLWIPERNALIGVSDAGLICELGTDGQVLRVVEPHTSDHQKYDFEDVCGGPDADHIYVLAERERLLLKLRLSDFSIESEATMATVGRPSANKAYEGIERLDDGSFVAASELFPPGLVFFDAALTKVTGVVSTGAPSLSAVMALRGTDELVIVSREYGLRLVRRDGVPLGPWRRIGLEYAEGVALVPGQGLFVCEDRVPSHVQVFRSLDSVEAVRAELKRAGR